MKLKQLRIEFPFNPANKFIIPARTLRLLEVDTNCYKECLGCTILKYLYPSVMINILVLHTPTDGEHV